MLYELEARLRNEVGFAQDGPRLWVGRDERGLVVDFFGEPYEVAFGELVTALRAEGTAESISSLHLAAPDVGANGTNNWDLSELVTGTHVFGNLTELEIARNLPGDHNRIVVGAEFYEDGMLARLLDKTPKISSLTVPSAPSAEFFEVGERPLRYLAVDVGYAHQGFIANLAKSECFPDLKILEFGEYSETHMEEFAELCTPFSDYEALFHSPVGTGLSRFVWRNPTATGRQMAELRTRSPNAQMLIVRWSEEYLRIQR